MTTKNPLDGLSKAQIQKLMDTRKGSDDSDDDNEVVILRKGAARSFIESLGLGKSNDDDDEDDDDDDEDDEDDEDDSEPFGKKVGSYFGKLR